MSGKQLARKAAVVTLLAFVPSASGVFVDGKTETFDGTQKDAETWRERTYGPGQSSVTQNDRLILDARNGPVDYMTTALRVSVGGSVEADVRVIQSAHEHGLAVLSLMRPGSLEWFVPHEPPNITLQMFIDESGRGNFGGSFSESPSSSVGGGVGSPVADNYDMYAPYRLRIEWPEQQTVRWMLFSGDDGTLLADETTRRFMPEPYLPAELHVAVGASRVIAEFDNVRVIVPEPGIMLPVATALVALRRWRSAPTAAD